MERRHNLPAPRTPLIGREDEAAAVRRLLLESEGRLVTLVGTGGCGKTRLALRLASDLVDAFPDGVWLVELAPLSDPALVPQAVAAAAGVWERPARSIEDGLVEALAGAAAAAGAGQLRAPRRRRAALAETLLSACPGLRLLATSREPLRIAGERAWRVPSLRAPDPAAALTPAALLAFPAARLFVERAAAVEPGFALDDIGRPGRGRDLRPAGRNRPGHRAGGGADRSAQSGADRRPPGRPVPPADRGSRTAPPRQQTLSATLDWSHELLAADGAGALPAPGGLRRGLGPGGVPRRSAPATDCRRRG